MRDGENMLRDPNSRHVIDHFNDRPMAQHYQMMLSSTFVPLFLRKCCERMSEWVLQCRDGHLPPSSSKEEDEGEQQC